MARIWGGRGRRNGDEQLPHVVTVDQARELLRGIDAQARHHQTMFAAIVVQHGDRAIVGPGSQRGCQLRTRAAGAIDKHWDAGIGHVVVGRKQQLAGEQPDTDQADQCQRGVNDQHAA